MHLLYLMIISLLINTQICSQFILNGDASQISCNQYQLTPDDYNKGGSIWNQVLISLNNPLKIKAKLYFGTEDTWGADGIAFVLQPLSNNIGGIGGGIGYAGINPSFAIEMDTWQNTNDPSCDHIAVMINGITNHSSSSNIAGPYCTPDLENGLWHTFEFNWDPLTNNVNVYLDGVLYVDMTYDIINNVFNGNPYVYWGFTAATGGAKNLHKVIFNMEINYAQIKHPCSGNDGAINVIVFGGVPAYSYQWSNGATTDSIYNLSPGYYYLTVTDGGGCVVDTFFYLLPPPQLSISSTNVSCYGMSDGSASVSVSGGASPYYFNWSNGQNVSTINNLQSGDYYVTVVDQNGCTKTSFVTITQPEPLQIEITQNIVSCYGGSDGTAYANVNGGTPPYQYFWSNGQTSPLANNLSEGTYTITVTDNNNCTSTSQVEIISNSPIMISFSKIDVSCYGYADGKIIANVNGGVPPYQYFWSNGENYNEISNLSEGVYVLTVYDSNNCSETSYEVINQPQQLVSFISKTDVSCFNSSNGSAEIIVTGGTQPYQYNWSNNQNTQYIQNLSYGIYYVTIIDNNGCSLVDSVLIEQPPELIVNVVSTDVTCYGGIDGTAHAIASGGTPPYQYNWSNGQISQSIYNLLPGVYYVTVIDNNGCISTSSVVINQAQQLNIQITKTDVSCYGFNDGAVYASVSGGVPPYSYSWSNGFNTNSIENLSSGTYVLTVTDNNNCSIVDSIIINQPAKMTASVFKLDNLCFGDSTGAINVIVEGGTPEYTYFWNTGSTTSNVSNLVAGIYNVTIKDANNCSLTLSVQINQPQKLEINIQPVHYICLGKTVTLTAEVEGGTPPYSFFWNDQISNNSLIISPQETSTYSLYIKDANNCLSDTYNVIIYVSPKLEFEVIADPTTLCPGDLVQITPIITGGVGPPYYIYDKNGNIVSPPIFIYPEEDEIYWFKAEDVCGVSDTAIVEINILPKPQISILADTTQGCEPLTVHFIEINPDSGNIYLWNFGDGSISKEKNPIHVFQNAGTYTITLSVISYNGCKSTKVFNDFINVWPKPKANFIWEPELISEIKPEVQFINLSEGATSFLWLFDNIDSSVMVSPTYVFDSAGEFLVSLISFSDKGCTDTITALLSIKKEVLIYIPNIFSPDGDKINDGFAVFGHNIEDFLLQIYDRWGNVIWETNKFYKEKGHSEYWYGTDKNGKMVPVGTYIWKVILRLNDKATKEFTGKITVVK